MAVWIRRAILAGAWIILSVAYKLIENAVLGWGNNVIADHLGLSSPTVSEAAQFLWLWGLPLALAAGTLCFVVVSLNWYNTRFPATPRANVREAHADELGDAAFVPIKDVAREVYGKTRGTRFCDFVESVSTHNGKLEQDTILDVCAGYVAGTTTIIFGKHPPSIQWERIDKSILNEGMFQNGSFHRHGNDDPAFTEISLLASDRANAVNQIVNDAKSADEQACLPNADKVQ